MKLLNTLTFRSVRVFLLCSLFLHYFAYPLYAENSIDFCFTSTADKYGIDPLLLEAISYVESRNNPLAISRNDSQSIDYGHMQINSYWIKYLGVNYLKLNDPCFCTKVGAAILVNCIDTHGLNANALSCYNSGKKMASLTQEVKPKVIAYIDKVKRRYDHLAKNLKKGIDG